MMGVGVGVGVGMHVAVAVAVAVAVGWWQRDGWLQPRSNHGSIPLLPRGSLWRP